MVALAKSSSVTLSSPDHIEGARLLTLRKMLQLEIKGLIHPRVNAFKQIKNEFKLSGSRETVLAKFTERLRKLGYLPPIATGPAKTRYTMQEFKAFSEIRIKELKPSHVKLSIVFSAPDGATCSETFWVALTKGSATTGRSDNDMVYAAHHGINYKDKLTFKASNVALVMLANGQILRA